MMTVRKCQQCGTSISSHVPEGNCPACLLLLAMDEGGGATEEPAPLEYFGDYEIHREIARGGMGVVYAARQVSLNRPVALKMVAGGKLTSPALVQRFRTEAEAAAKLDHPNIIPIYEIGEHDAQHFYSMKLMQKGDLAQAITRQEFPASTVSQLKRIARFVAEIARAVAYAHQRGILHRDIKPTNVLLDAAGKPHVADFGLAKIVEHDSGLTLSVAIMGTPSYMAPEQAAGRAKQLTTASDIYSLGAILYELITAEPPFRGETPLETMRRVVEDEPKAPRELNPAVDRDLETICLKALSKDPARRYSSADAFAADLERWVAGETIDARPVQPAEKFWRWCKRKPLIAALTAVVVILLTTLAIGSTVALVRITAAQKAQLRENYFSNIALADQLISKGSVNHALDLLLKCPPEFRNWEWGRLMYQCHQAVQTIRAHTNSVRWVKFNQAGSQVASFGGDGTLKIWEVDSGKQLFSFGDSSNQVVSAAFSGSQLAAGLTNGAFKLWTNDSWREAVELPPHNQSVKFVLLTEDGRVITSAGPIIRAHDGRTGQSIFETKIRFAPAGLHLTSDQSQIIAVSALNVSMIRASSGEELVFRQFPSEQFRAVAADPTGKRLVTVGFDNTIQIWTSNRVEHTVPVSRSTARFTPGFFFSKDGKLLCIGGEAGTARVWDLENREELFPIPGRVARAQFSEDNTQLFTSGNDRTAKVWDVQSGRELLSLRGHTARIEAAALSDDGRLVATGTFEGELKIWSATPGRELFTIGSIPWEVTYSPDGKEIALASIRHRAVLRWDAESGLEHPPLETPFHWATSVEYSRDGKKAVTGGGLDPRAIVWDVTSGKPLVTLAGHDRAVFVASFSADATRIATGSGDATARIWNAHTGEHLRTLPHRDRVWEVQFSPNGEHLLTLSRGNCAQLWNVRSGELAFKLRQTETEETIASCYSPDGKLIGTVAADRVLALWDARTGALVQSWQGGQYSTFELLFSPDGTRLVTGSSELDVIGNDASTIEFWDVQSGRQVLALAGHSESIQGLAFTPDAKRMVSSSFDFDVRQWEAFPWKEQDYPGLHATPLRERVSSYARDYWRKRLAAEQSSPLSHKTDPPAALQTVDPALPPPRDPAATSRQLDLAPHYNGLLHLPWQPEWHVRFSDNDLRTFIAGCQSLGGITFDARGVMQLRRIDPTVSLNTGIWRIFAQSITDIRLDHRCKHLHVLHAATHFAPDGTIIGKVRLNYSDGTQHELPIVYGIHVRSWWKGPHNWSGHADPADITSKAEVAWTGINPPARKDDATLRLYKTTLDNPRPEMIITHIDLLSTLAPSGLFVLAITTED